MRLNKLIASHTEFSRRKADELIKKGLVFVNGKKVEKLGIEINEKNDKIEIQGIPLKAIQKKIYIALNKPKGYVTTRQDEQGRKTVMLLVPKIPNLKPVGRLDTYTEGLLLLSTDGEFIYRHTHPKFECEKEYFAKIQEELTPKEKYLLENGIEINGKKTAKAKISILKNTKDGTDLRITIHEGRNKQIRIGKILLGTLKIGTYRSLTNSEINAN